MNKISFFVLFITIFSFFGMSKVYAEDGYLQCYEECTTDLEKKHKVRSYVYSNASTSELWTNIRIYKTVHIVNLNTGGVNSYRATIVPPEDDTDDVNIQVYEISASSIVKNKIKPAADAFRNLSKVANAVTIPSSVVPGAWDFINCAYCENNVNDFVSRTLQGQIETVTTTIATVTAVLGLTYTAIPNTYRIGLEAGGYIEVEMKLLNTPVALTLKVIKVVDNNNNTVPLIAAGLKNLGLQIASFVDIININNKIKDFNFGAPVRMGYVRIRDCTPNPDYTGKPGQDPCEP